jgi:hypothetical protein
MDLAPVAGLPVEETLGFLGPAAITVIGATRVTSRSRKPDETARETKRTGATARFARDRSP